MLWFYVYPSVQLFKDTHSQFLYKYTFCTHKLHRCAFAQVLKHTCKLSVRTTVRVSHVYHTHTFIARLFMVAHSRTHAQFSFLS